MNRLESWLLHASTIVLALTGIVYAWMRYLMKPVDPFSVVNHPLEPYMLHIHILVAPLLILGFGIIFHGHILFKKASGARAARRSGLFLIPCFTVMAISGYLLQVITSDFRKVLVVLHLVSGVLWTLLYVGHQVASYALRKTRSNGNHYRLPVQILVMVVITAFAGNAGAEPFERNVQSMGTQLRVVSLEQDHATALAHTEALIQIVEQADQQLSTWKQYSELSRLNRAPVGRPFPVSAEVFLLLQRVQQFCKWTGGTFDPGIGKLLQAWDIHGKFRVPSSSELASALNLSGIRHLRFNSSDWTVTRLRDVWLDPGAFGKGEALDRAIALARDRKMAPVLIDFGGQVAVHGVPGNVNAWAAALSQPQNRHLLTTHIWRIAHGSFSTSGYSERSAQVGDTFVQHILDPSTGHPAEPFGSVTVWNSSALVADVLSTALYVMGPQKGYEWAIKNKIAAAFSTGKDLAATPEFAKHVTVIR